MATTSYRFVHHWRMQSTVQEVWHVFNSAEDLTRWWPSIYLEVKKTKTGEKGGLGEEGSIYSKGWLPYTLRWNYRITESKEPYSFSLEAYGDFTGRGIWTFVQDGSWVDITYEWIINADKPLLKYTSFVFKPLFRSNHIWAMRKGETSLNLELKRRRARTPEERARIPAPPGPMPVAPMLIGALGAIVIGVWLEVKLVVRGSGVGDQVLS